MVEERERGIRVMAILPGLVDTPILLNRLTPPPRGALEKALQPEDLVHACAFPANCPPEPTSPN